MGVEEATEKSMEIPQDNNNLDLDIEEGEIINAEEQQDKEQINKTHPLEYSWTFWFDNPAARSKTTEWGSSMRPIFTFSTVQEFWSLYNNIHQPSKLATRADFYCFKHNIEPKWEDPICANGGKWTVTYVRGKADNAWLNTLLAMIGEQFDHGDEICGVVVNVRKEDKISIWTKDATNEAAQLSIGRQWKKFLDYSESIGFIFHDDAMKYERAAKNRYHC